MLNVYDVKRNDNEISIKYEVYPEIKLKNIDKIKESIKKEKISKKELDEEINKVLIGSTKVDKSKNSKDPIKNGDIAIISYTVSNSNKKIIPGLSANDVEIKIGAGGNLKELEDGLIGLVSKDKKDIKVKFKKDFNHLVLSNSDVVFKVEINKVFSSNIIKIEEYINKYNKKETADEFKTRIEEDLKTKKQNEQLIS